MAHSLRELPAAMANKEIRVKIATSKLRRERKSTEVEPAKKRGYCEHCACESCAERRAKKQRKST